MPVLILGVSLLSVGCGGGSSGGGSTSRLAQVQGNWKIVLSENQAAIIAAKHSVSSPIDPNPTEIAISLNQSNAIVTTSETLYTGNTGCDLNGSWWYATGPYNSGWEYGTYSFAFDSGLVSGNTVTLTLIEAASFQGGQPTAPNGQLKLLGTVQADGSIKGTLTDGCVLDSNGNMSNQTFTATHISTFPPTTWP